MKMTFVWIWLALAIPLLAGCGGGNGDGAEGRDATPDLSREAVTGEAILQGEAPGEPAVPGETVAETQTVHLAISGMYCQGCADGIQAALGRIPGVNACTVTYTDSLAVLSVDPTVITVPELIQVVEDTGYEATLQP
jgi:copper chaperone